MSYGTLALLALASLWLVLGIGSIVTRVTQPVSMSALVVALVTLCTEAAALAPGSTVTVIGASGNVGKLVALRLSETFKVRGVVRSAARARSFLPDVELFECDLRDGPTASLAKALDGAAGLVVCTGTTAFPTKAWSETGRDDVTFPVLQALFEAKGDRYRAVWKSTSELGYRADAVTATTSRRWRGIATPSSRRSYGDNIASMAWGARNLIST